MEFLGKKNEIYYTLYMSWNLVLKQYHAGYIQHADRLFSMLLKVVTNRKPFTLQACT